jgi:hypothetical protein
MGSRPTLYITKKGALDSQPQVIKLTSCLPMVDGSLQVLRIVPPLKLVAMIWNVATYKWKAHNGKIERHDITDDD